MALAAHEYDGDSARDADYMQHCRRCKERLPFLEFRSLRHGAEKIYLTCRKCRMRERDQATERRFRLYPTRQPRKNALKCVSVTIKKNQRRVVDVGHHGRVAVLETMYLESSRESLLPLWPLDNFAPDCQNLICPLNIINDNDGDTQCEYQRACS